MAAMAEGNILQSAAESLIKKALIADGASKSYAECMVSMIKTTGATDDIFDLRSYFEPDELADKIHTKFKIANFICSNGGYKFLGFIVIVLLSVVACVCCFYCCFEEEPVVVQLTRPYSGQKMRQERIYTVWEVATELNVNDKKKSSTIFIQRDYLLKNVNKNKYLFNH